MDLTTVDLEKIPAENLHVARAEFVRVWAAVERHQDVQLARHIPDWYGGGVQAVCRWLARATVRPAGGQWRPARSPVSGRQDRAYPELIDAECLAADGLLSRRPLPRWLEERPGWAESIVATLDWAWRYSGRPPTLGEHRTAS